MSLPDGRRLGRGCHRLGTPVGEVRHPLRSFRQKSRLSRWFKDGLCPPGLFVGGLARNPGSEACTEWETSRSGRGVPKTESVTLIPVYQDHNVFLRRGLGRVRTSSLWTLSSVPHFDSLSSTPRLRGLHLDSLRFFPGLYRLPGTGGGVREGLSGVVVPLCLATGRDGPCCL